MISILLQARSSFKTWYTRTLRPQYDGGWSWPPPCPPSPHPLLKEGPLTPVASNQQYQGVMAQKCSAIEEIEIPPISLMLQWDDAIIFISSQPQELQLTFLKQTSEVEGRVWLWGIQGSGNCPTRGKFVVIVVWKCWTSKTDWPLVFHCERLLDSELK